jgi:hypothetical protein
MRTLRRATLALVLAMIEAALATAARAEPVRIVLLSAPTRNAAPGEMLDAPFRVRVERASGEPLAGVVLSYAVDLCITVATPPPGWECPNAAEYGGFDDGASLQVLVTTGSDGTVTAPPFRAGNPTAAHLPFGFKVLPYASTQTTPGGFTITLNDAVSPIGGYWAAATTVNIEGVQPIPALDGARLLLLVLLLAVAGAWRLRSMTDSG